MKKHKVAIYIRVSTKKQVEEGYSLDAQLERLTKLCETNGYIIYKIYTDEGKSGKDTNRPAFQDMMKDMRNKEFDKILVMKLDRISRSVIDLELMIKEMQQYNVEFESSSEKIDTSSSFGMMFVRLLGIFAQFERERIRERISDTFETMIAEGKPITGTQPIGYKNENGKVVKDNDTEDLVNYFFDTFEKTSSLRRAGLYTNQKFNISKNVQNYRKMLNQTHYYGSYKGNDNYCPAYLTKERWDYLQTLRKNRHVKAYDVKRYYLFAGLLVDSNCGTRMSGTYSNKSNSSKEYFLYRCRKHTHSRTCNTNISVNEKILEEFLIDNINTYIDEYFNSLEKEYKISATKYKDSSKELAQLKEEQRRINIIFAKGRIEEKEYDREYERLEKEIKKLESQPVKKDISHLKNLKTIDWKTMYNELNRENKQAFWRKFIDKIEIDPFNYKKGKDYIRLFFV